MPETSDEYGVVGGRPDDLGTGAWDRERKRKPDVSARLLLQQLRLDTPGMQTDNRLEQSNHYRGVIYIAIRALRDALASARVSVTRKRSHPAAPKFVPGVVRKSVPTTLMGDEHEHEPLTDARHSLVRLLDRPNPTENITDILGSLVIQYHLTGQGLLWGAADAHGLPAELYVLPTGLCLAQPPTPQYPGGYWRVQSYYPSIMGMLPMPMTGSGAILDARDVFQLKNTHPLWRWDGYSPLTAGASQLDILESIDTARWSAMKLGVTPDSVLMAPGLPQEELNAVVEMIRQNNGGEKNFRKLLALGGGAENGRFDFKPWGVAAKDMDFSAGWEQMTSFALALFGVPKAIAGLSATTSYAELYAALKQFMTLSMHPLASRLAAFLTRCLARIWGDDLEIQIELPTVQNEEQDEHRFETDLAHDLLTYNQALAKRGLPSVGPEGDVLCSVYVDTKKAAVQLDIQKKQQEMQMEMQAKQAQQQQAAAQQQQPQGPGQDQEQPESDPHEAIAALLGGASNRPEPSHHGPDEEEGSEAIASLLGMGATPAAATPPAPDNPDAEGTLPPRINKSHESVPPQWKWAVRRVMEQWFNEDGSRKTRSRTDHVVAHVMRHQKLSWADAVKVLALAKRCREEEYRSACETKAMSALSDSGGGALVAPPATGEPVPLKRNKAALLKRKKRVRKTAQFCKGLLKSGYESLEIPVVGDASTDARHVDLNVGAAVDELLNELVGD